jgi:hypothetical protein
MVTLTLTLTLTLAPEVPTQALTLIMCR